MNEKPEIIIQLAKAREIFDKTSKHDNESSGVQQLLGFFAKRKYLTSGQVIFANKLIKLSQTVRTK